MFIFFPGKENEPKETAVSRFILRVATSVGARGDSPAFRRGQTGPRAYSARRVDARRGTKGKNLKPK
jgi:hypothetical protein